jgi:hypothetical protein
MRLRPTIGAAGRRRDRPLRFAPRGGQKQPKRNDSFRKRNQRFREACRKVLKSLGREISDFAGSFVFNTLIAISFRAFLAHAFSR